MPGKKVVLTEKELSLAIEGLKAFRQTIVSVIGIEFVVQKQRDVLSDARVGIEIIIEKLEKARDRGA